MTQVDTRRQRTRDALLGAFFVLVLERRYHEIRIDDILARAGVGRSTFYEHFRNKDALLGAALEGPFSIFAQVIVESNPTRMQALLDHFWQNRALARGILLGAVRRRTDAVLINMIEQQLKRTHGAYLRVPPRLAAVALAELQLAPITAWLLGESACESAVLASVIDDSVQRAMGAFSVQPAVRPPAVTVRDGSSPAGPTAA